jgi:hypothetical protein
MNKNSRGPWNHSSHEEYEGEEYPVEEDESFNSKERNSNIFHSKGINAKLSTALRRQSTVDNPVEAAPLCTAPIDESTTSGRAKAAAVAQRLRSHDAASAGSNVPGRDRPPALSDRCALLVAEDSQWLHDHDTPTKSNITRAARLWETSGLSEAEFYSLLHEAKSKARAETKARKRCAEHSGQYNRMPLYFAALEQLIGLRDEHGQRRGEGEPQLLNA